MAREKYRMIGRGEKQYIFVGIPESEKERLVGEVREEEAARLEAAPAEKPGN